MRNEKDASFYSADNVSPSWLFECGLFRQTIETVDSERIVFGTIAVTRKACIDMDIPNRFHQHINNVQTYSIKDLKLHLVDDQGNELFGFRKID